MFATTAATITLVSDCSATPLYGGACKVDCDGAASDSQTFDAIPFYGGCPNCDAGLPDDGATDAAKADASDASDAGDADGD